MNDLRWQLQMASTLDSQFQLGRILSHLFSDQQLFLNKPLRKHIQQDRKGYVHLSVLQNMPLIQQYFSMIQLSDSAFQLRFIQGAAEDFCPELLYRWGRIRRLNAFDFKRFKSEKPISLQRIIQKQTISDLRDIIGIDSFTMNPRIQPKMEEKVLIYTNSYREAMREQNNLPFRILDYSQLCKEKERRSRYWEMRQQSYYRPFNISVTNDRNFMKKTREYHELNDHEIKQRESEQRAIYEAICRQPNPNFNEYLDFD